MQAFARTIVVVVGLLVGCTTPPDPESEEPPPAGLANGSYVEIVGGRTMHYEIHGSGPVLMAVPNSWGLSLGGLRGLFRPLEEAATMVYFDPRGMGASSPVEDPEDMSMEAVREDFHALRGHLGLGAVNAIGWSNGAMNLMVLAAEQPRTIRSAIIVHSAASFGPEDMARLGEQHPVLMAAWMAHEAELATMDPGDPRTTAAMKEFWLSRYFPEMTGDPEASIRVIREAFEGAQFSRAHVVYTNAAHPAFDVTAELPKITARSLVVAGVHDMMAPERVQVVADGIADAVFSVYEHSGHFAPLEEPERFRSEVLAFLGVERAE